MNIFGKRSTYGGELQDIKDLATASAIPWKDYPLRDKKRSVRLGPCRFWFYEKDDDLWLAEWHGTDSSDKPPAEADDDSWKRWGLNTSYKALSVRPAMAPVPHLVVPEAPLIVAPRVKIRLFIQTPIWFQLYLRSRHGAVMISEFPTVELSKTWFGDTTFGELCYSLKTKAMRSVDMTETLPHYAISPLVIKNASDEDLKIERLCLRGDALALYQGSYRIWTSATRINFMGRNHSSQIRISESVPEEVENKIPIGLPRDETQKKNFLARTFSHLKLFSNYSAGGI